MSLLYLKMVKQSSLTHFLCGFFCCCCLVVSFYFGGVPCFLLVFVFLFFFFQMGKVFVSDLFCNTKCGESSSWELCMFWGLAEGEALEQLLAVPVRRAAADGAAIMLVNALILAQELNLQDILHNYSCWPNYSLIGGTTETRSVLSLVLCLPQTADT